MRTARTIEIDGSKLKKEFAQRNLLLSDVSEEIGFSRGYLNKCSADQRICASALQLIDIKYGVKLDNIKKEETKPVYQIGAKDDSLVLQAIDSLGNDLNENTKQLAEITSLLKEMAENNEKTIKTFNVTCAILTKNAEQIIANQQKEINALTFILNKVK